MRKGAAWGVLFLLLCFFSPSLLWAGTPLEFSVHDLASGNPGATALIVGGIQGDEPGGFNAAALITTHYDIRSGRVIVVPNLNFPSIVRRSRGVHGDMNRKFARLTPDDPEWKTVGRIKSLITDPEVDFILNLHDGSGFYTHTWKSAQRNPNRWGQSIIIDQAKMPESTETPAGTFDDLEEIARGCARDMNTRLLSTDHKIHVKNTRTAEGNREMEKTLTYFALKHGKPAFGIEASKTFLTPGRVYYHLLAIEAFLTRAGISFERRFTLTDRGIKTAMDEGIAVHLGNRRVLVMAENVRNHLRFIPMEKGWDMDFHVNHPLLTLVPKGKGYQLYHGNRRLSRLDPQYFEYDLKLDKIDMVVDGRNVTVPFGSQVKVRERFLVQHIPDHRVNIIGFSRKNTRSESGFVVREKDFSKRFSIDRDGRIYRVEVYGSGRFNGMVLVDFRSGQGPVKLARAGVLNRERQALHP
ncbi:MAG: succinylglutamate desuccinylase/aspartoacylase family protein [Desulfobacterales bacterium]|nr:succinylglutamate desuccinylase/aspartoacylase family protein [Desulfobacterales bacterium]